VAENYRRAPENRAIKWALSSGRIGDVRMVYWVDVGERLWYWTWREHRQDAGGGWPLDGGVHFADLFRYHVGPVESLYAEVRNFFPYRFREHEGAEPEKIEVDAEDTTLAEMRFQGDATGTWISTTAAPGWDLGGRAVYGSEGCLNWGQGLKTRSEELAMPQLVSEYMAQLSDEDKQRLFPNGVTDTVATELKEFIDACRLGTPIETDGLEGYKAMAICFGLYESAALHAPVQIADIENLTHERYQRDLNEGLGLG
jgi:predicted dehydrogenase